VVFREVLVSCGYCQQRAELVTGEAVYPHMPELWEQAFYLCRPCGAYVGCHPGTVKPLGRLANAELRQAKMSAHKAFDALWRGCAVMSRRQAYRWLADRLGIQRSHCHIGMFDVDQCRRVVDACNSRASR
jgi:hypothetical protein